MTRSPLSGCVCVFVFASMLNSQHTILFILFVLPINPHPVPFPPACTTGGSSVGNYSQRTRAKGVHSVKRIHTRAYTHTHTHTRIHTPRILLDARFWIAKFEFEPWDKNSNRTKTAIFEQTNRPFSVWNGHFRRKKSTRKSIFEQM